MAEFDPTRGDERGISEVLGYSLIFGLILISITAVSVGGIDSLRSVRDAEQLNNAERAFEVLADNTADIYKQDAPSRATEFSVGGATLFSGTNTTIEFSAGGSTLRSFTVTPLVFRSGQGNQVVYEAGAIFRTRRDAGSVAKEPPMDWSGAPALLTIVGTFARNTQSVAGTDVIARMKTRHREVAFDGTTPIDTIRIESERADLWLRYLESATPSPVSCSQTANVVTCDVSSGPPLVVTVHEIQMQLEQ